MGIFVVGMKAVFIWCFFKMRPRRSNSVYLGKKDMMNVGGFVFKFAWNSLEFPFYGLMCLIRDEG